MVSCDCPVSPTLPTIPVFLSHITCDKKIKNHMETLEGCMVYQHSMPYYVLQASEAAVVQTQQPHGGRWRRWRLLRAAAEAAAGCGMLTHMLQLCSEWRAQVTTYSSQYSGSGSRHRSWVTSAPEAPSHPHPTPTMTNLSWCLLMTTHRVTLSHSTGGLSPTFSSKILSSLGFRGFAKRQACSAGLVCAAVTRHAGQLPARIKHMDVHFASRSRRTCCEQDL